MKKILTALVVFVFVALPMSVMAMTTITDTELSTVTGQAGVSINVDFTTDLSIGTVAWGDSDGQATMGLTGAGYVGITALTMQIHMSGRHDGPFAGGANYLFNDPITIDVGTSAAGASMVVIGLPTAHITVSTLATDIFVSGANAGDGTPGDPQVLGSLYIDGLEIVLGQPDATDPVNGYTAGYVTIGAAAADNRGVNIGFNVKIDSVTIDTISYGNANSLIAAAFPAGAATGGYVGLKNFVLDDVTIAGGVAIGVGTLNGTAVGVPSFGTPTMVNIVIAAGTTIAIPGAIQGTILLASDRELNTNVGELGNFYIGGVVATFQDNVDSFSAHSLVQIWAH